MHADTPATEPSTTDATAREPRNSPARRYLPGRWCWLLVALSAIAIVVLRVAAPAVDHANVNIATLILAFTAFMTVGLWFALFSAYPMLVRFSGSLAIVMSVALWFAFNEVDSVSGNLVPQFKRRGAQAPDERLKVPVGQTIVEDDRVDLATTTEYDFPQFLGPDRDLKVDSVRLARDWSHPPREVWRQPIGAGWSAFVAVNGFAVTLEQRGGEELVTCYELETGRLRWSHAIQGRHETKLGGVGPRSTPTVHRGKVYAFGPTGVLRCLNGSDGSLVWMHNVLDDFGISPEDDGVGWGRANSPLIVDDLLVLPYGGPPDGKWKSLAAFDKQTGEMRWTAGDRQVAFASPRLATLAGRRQILLVSENAAGGYDAESGQPLWTWDWPGGSRSDANVSQPVPIEGDRVLLSKGYGGGSAMLRVSEKDGRWTVEEIWRNRASLKTKLTNVVATGGYLYGLSDGILECVEADNGRRAWKKGRYGHGQILLVGDVLLVQAETGEVALVEASPSDWRELGRFAALDGKTWTNLCLYGPYLLVRNAEEAACYKLPLAAG